MVVAWFRHVGGPMPIKTALMGVVPPVVIALVALLAAWRPWGKTAPSARVGAAGSALALALAYFVTERLLVGTFAQVPPQERYRWLPYAGLAAAAGAIFLRSRGEARWTAHDCIALAVFVALSWKHLTSQSGFFFAALWVLVSVMMSSSIRGDAVRLGPSGVRVPLTWMVACIGTSVVFVQSSEAIYGQLMGSVAAVLGVFFVVALWRRGFEVVRGVAPVFAVLYVGMVLVSTGMTVVSAVLSLIAAATPAMAGMPMFQKARPWVTTAACMGAAAVLSVLAVWQSENGFNFNINGSP
jgi:hypothetical protein